MTYARARLLTGSLGVGLHVLWTGLALLWLLPHAPEPQSVGLPGLALATYLLVSLPFDLAGGYWLPVLYGRRPAGTGAQFVACWLRGVGMHTLVLVCSFGGYWLSFSSGGGRIGMLVFAVVATAALSLGRLPLALLIGTLRAEPANGKLRYLLSEDPGFTGGVDGGTVILPSHWRNWSAEQLAVVILRRQLAIQEGGDQRGRLVGAGWNLAGIALSLVWLPASPGLVLVVMLCLASTLWGFLGLLLLPTISRQGVFALDVAARHGGVTPKALVEAIIGQDRLQDDEPERRSAIEAVFHPIPSVARRLENLRVGVRQPMGAWHAARYALALSPASLSLLSRAVHCNVGRPDLWVFLPAD